VDVDAGTVMVVVEPLAACGYASAGNAKARRGRSNIVSRGGSVRQLSLVVFRSSFNSCDQYCEASTKCKNEQEEQ